MFKLEPRAAPSTALMLASPLLALAIFRGTKLIPQNRRLEQLRHTAEEIITKLGFQGSAVRQYQRADVALWNVDLLHAIDQRSAHQGHASPVDLHVLVCHDPAYRHGQVQSHLVAG